MNRMIRTLVALLLAGSVGAIPVAAQDWLGARISLDLKSMAPAQAFKVIADAVGATVSVDPAVTTPVDIVVRNVTARTALTTMCESIGCRWTVEAGAITVKPAAVGREGGRVAMMTRAPRDSRQSQAQRNAFTEKIRAALKQPLPAGMTFDKAPLDVVSQRLGEALGLKMRISSEDPAVTTVTGDFSGKTIQGVLEVLVAQTGSKRVVWRLEFDIEGEKSPSVVLLSVVGAKSRATVKKSPR